MKLSISGNQLYADNLKVCFCEPGNERSSLPAGRHRVTIEYSHLHGAELPKVDGFGWIGAKPGCDIVLGGVVGRSGVIPRRSFVDMLIGKIEAAEGMGKSTFLEVEQ